MDVELNLVPFIDMMSCMVAFLLLSAVWTNVAQIGVSPRGGVGQAAHDPAQPRELVAILITRDGHWVGHTGEAPRRVERIDGARDWAGLGAALAQVARPGLPIEIAAEDGVDFQTIVATMDRAIAEGLADVAYVDPAALSLRFSE